jgi:hypothetical protein
MKERGSITKLLRNQRPGYILGEDGCMVAFDESSLDGPEVQKLSVGDWVEYDELQPTQGRRAAHIRKISSTRGNRLFETGSLP